MSECEELRPRLVAWMDAELSEEEGEGLRRHVACCELCAGLMEEYQAIRQAASAWEEPQESGEATLLASGGLWERVQSHIQTEEWTILRRELEQTRQMVRDLQADVSALRHQLNQQPNQHKQTNVKLPGVLLPCGISDTPAARHRPLL